MIAGLYGPAQYLISIRPDSDSEVRPDVWLAAIGISHSLRSCDVERLELCDRRQGCQERGDEQGTIATEG